MESDSDDADPNLWLQLLLVGFLTLINALFAATELSVLSVNKNKIKKLDEEGNKKAKAVLRLLGDETKFLSTIQIGITLAGMFSSATVAANLAQPVGVWLAGFNIPYAIQIASVGLTLILSYITLVFGELFPKRVARRFPEKVALFMARPVNVLKKIATPLVKLLSLSSDLIVKITRIEAGMKDDKVSEDDIRSMVETGVTDGSIESNEQLMIENIFKFNDLDAMDVMTPRVDVFMIDIEEDINEYLDDLIFGRYTRIPIYSNNRDNIIGIINIKDVLIQARKKGFNKIDIKKILRPPFFVADHSKINHLYQKMQKTNNHLAILTDEFGGITGIVSLEDIIEEIMGNIYDEFDEDVPMIIAINDNNYIVDGSTPIQDINRGLDLELDEDNDEYDTIGGLIISIINRIPTDEVGLVVEFENLIMTVTKMDGNRIDEIHIEITAGIDDSDDSDNKEDITED